ncbi:glycosyltransferase 87 family protein [Ekhidna sp. To15]|uniref:glycosyltransferase 87 family protein n=1 Tax=Ekhidna sp. To15 TaxID=3395267 RepID=UPI003F51B4C0
MPNQHKTGYYTFLAIYILAIFSIGNWIERHASFTLILAYSSAFFSYIFLLQKQENDRLLFNAGIIIRVLLFLSLPTLSDDLYRFIWDGTLLKNGIHPFEALPGSYLNQGIEGISQELFEKLNSPNYFTIYPPLNQLIFWVSVTIAKGDWLVSANTIRIILYAADVGSFFLLRRLLQHYGKSQSLAYWFWLNPLVILEFTGNLHFEGLVIFFVLLGVYCFEKNKKWFSAIGFGLAIGTKLLPLIYLPFLFLKGLKEKKWLIPIGAGIIGIATLLPLFNETFIIAMRESLDLYFRSFEFNASIYFIAREIGFWIYGYNKIALIGPLLSVFSVVSILTVSVIGTLKKWSVPKTLMFVLTAYLLFATTVHPWYILPLVALGILSGYWYPVVWSFLIFLTYLGYSQAGFELPIHIIVVEYVVTGLVLLVEVRTKNK